MTCDLKIYFLFEKAQRPQNRCKVLAVKCKKVLHFRCIFCSIFLLPDSEDLFYLFIYLFIFWDKPDSEDLCQQLCCFHKISTNFSRKLTRLQFLKKRKSEKMTQQITLSFVYFPYDA